MKLYRIGQHEKNIIFSDNIENPVIYSENEKLMKIKCKIDECNSKKWEEAKKYNNNYEYIYTSSNLIHNVCNISPISRSYFKLHEMIKNNHLLESDIYCSCLAEGPGGFINCINHLSNEKNLNIKNVYGITLISSDKKIPYWNQQILNQKMNIICSGEDKTGDIYNYKNVDDFINTINLNYCHLVTADGGFDYSENYNLQELSSYKLIYSEIYISLNIQKLKGNFIIKIFDLFTYKTIQLIYLLYNCYSIIEFYKPLTSRLSNSEKYIICSGFQGCPNNVKTKLKEYFNKSEELHIDVPQSFIDDINKYNESFVKSQISSIEGILDLIKKEDTIKKGPTPNQIESAVRWCELYELPINEKCTYLK